MCSPLIKHKDESFQVFILFFKCLLLALSIFFIRVLPFLLLFEKTLYVKEINNFQLYGANNFPEHIMMKNVNVEFPFNCSCLRNNSFIYLNPFLFLCHFWF